MAVRVRLDRKIKIQAPVEANVNGDIETAWVDFLTAWADRRDVSDKEMEGIDGMARVSKSYTEWIIAFPPTAKMPTSKMQVVEVGTGAIYDIENIYEPNYSVKEYLVLKALQKQQR